MQTSFLHKKLYAKFTFCKKNLLAKFLLAIFLQNIIFWVNIFFWQKFALGEHFLLAQSFQENFCGEIFLQIFFVPNLLFG